MDYTLEQLKKIAKYLNLTFSPNIGLDKLKEKIDTYITENDITLDYASILEEETFSTDNASVTIESKEDVEIERLRNLTFAGTELTKTQMDEAKQNREALKLIRCIVTCNDPTKSALEGNFFAARNAEISTVQKYIPFGVPTHVPQILLNVIKDKDFTQYTSKKSRDNFGLPVTKRRIQKAYNIEYLPPLTTAEFNAIATRQLADPIGENE